MASDGRIGALVLLRTVDGRRPEAADLTADRIEGLVPDPQVVERVSAFFPDAGFDVGGGSANAVCGLSQPAATGPDLATGHGLVDAHKAVLAAKIRCLPVVEPTPPAGPESPGVAPAPGLTGRDIAALERLLARSRGLGL